MFIVLFELNSLVYLYLCKKCNVKVIIKNVTMFKSLYKLCAKAAVICYVKQAGVEGVYNSEYHENHARLPNFQILGNK
jgi:hypothetical protein